MKQQIDSYFFFFKIFYFIILLIWDLLKMLLLFVSVWMGYRLINGMDFIIFEFHVSFFVLLFWIFSNPMYKIWEKPKTSIFFFFLKFKIIIKFSTTTNGNFIKLGGHGHSSYTTASNYHACKPVYFHKMRFFSILWQSAQRIHD